MLEYFNQFCSTVGDYPTIVAIISNLVLGLVMLCAVWIPQRVVGKAIKKARENSLNRKLSLFFDRFGAVAVGTGWSLVISLVGMMIVSTSFLCPQSANFPLLVVVFSVVPVFVRMLVDSNSVDKAKLPSHVTLYRISAVTFLVAATFSVLSVRFSHDIVHGFSLIMFSYYFCELYFNRRYIDKCFVISDQNENSIMLKFAGFLSKNFLPLSFIGMSAVMWLNHQKGIPLSDVLYVNILGMFSVLTGVFLVQGCVTFVVNWFIAALSDIGKEKVSKKSLKLRKSNWMGLCDFLIMIYYLSVALIVMWLLDVDVWKYMIVDKTVSIIFIVFISVLVFKMFSEFSNAYVDKADPADRDKILTFMPIVKVMFNVLLFFLAGLSVLAQLGIPIGPFLASFAAVGAAVALAAQDLVKGFLHGIILLIENNFYMGDFVTINGQGGIVVKISTRTLTLRDFNGDEYSIPYNTIGVIINHSREYYVHYESLLVSPHADVKKAGNLLIEVVQKMKTEPEFVDKILGDVQITGIKTFSDEGLHICWSLKTSTAGRLLHLEIYRRLLPLLRDAGIPIPYKQEYTEHLLTVSD